MHPVEQHYRKRIAEAAEIGPEQFDYHGQDQGEYGTNLRHKAVVEVAERLDGSILELGCGTGLLIEEIVACGKKPEYYAGVDGILERKEPFEQRLKMHKIAGEFIHKPMDVPFETGGLPVGFSLVLCVGVCGYWGYHTVARVNVLYKAMRRMGRHGVMTFPMVYGPNGMGSENLRRWEVDEIVSVLCPARYSSVKKLEREFLIYW